MPISFPPSPTPGETYTFNSKVWQWTGTYWESLGQPNVTAPGVFVPAISLSPTPATGPADTTAIQQAIDAAAAAGGGLVQLPPGKTIHIFPVLADTPATDNYEAGACLVIRDKVRLWGPGTTLRAGAGPGLAINDCRRPIIANDNCRIWKAVAPGITEDFSIEGVCLDQGGRLYDVQATSGTGFYHVAGNILSLLVDGQPFRAINGTTGAACVGTVDKSLSVYNGGSLRTEIKVNISTGSIATNGTIGIITQSPNELQITLVGATIGGTTINFAAGVGDVSSYFPIGSTFGVRNSGGGNLAGGYIVTNVSHSGSTTVTVASTAGITAAGSVYPALRSLWYGDASIFHNCNRFSLRFPMVQGAAKYGVWIYRASNFDAWGNFDQESDGFHPGGGCTNFRLWGYGRCIDNKMGIVSGEEFYRAAVNTAGNIIGCQIMDCEEDSNYRDNVNPIRFVGPTGTRIEATVWRFRGHTTLGNAIEAIDDTSVGGISGAEIHVRLVDVEASVGSSGNSLFQGSAAGLKNLVIDKMHGIAATMASGANGVSLFSVIATPCTVDNLVISNLDMRTNTSGKVINIGAFMNVRQASYTNCVARLNGAAPQAFGIQGVCEQLTLRNCQAICNPSGTATVFFYSDVGDAIIAGVTGTTFIVAGDQRWKYLVGQRFRVKGNSTAAANTIYTVISTSFSTNTTITVSSTNGAAASSGRIQPHTVVTADDCEFLHEPTTQATNLTNCAGSIEFNFRNTISRTNSTSSIQISPNGDNASMTFLGSGGLFTGYTNGGTFAQQAGSAYNLRVNHRSIPLNLANATLTTSVLIPQDGDELLNVANYSTASPFSPPAGLVRYRRHSSTVGGWQSLGDTINGGFPTGTSSTGPTNLNVNHQDVVINNTGAVGSVTYTLPAALPGMRFRINRTAAQNIVLTPQAAEFIEDLTVTTGVNKGAGVGLTLNTTGPSFVVVECAVAGVWRATNWGNARANFT